jgi:hypothetical protein
MAKTKPAEFAKAITLSDTTDIDFEGKADATRGIYVGSGGDISVEMAGTGLSDATVVFVAVPTGSLLAVEATRVNSTGTTASSLVAIW